MSTYKDNINILKHLSFYRLWNLVALKLSFYLSRIFKKPILWGKPYSVSIEPTTACNLACPECPSGLKKFSRPTGKLTLETNKNILSQIGKQLFYINYYFQGEPFLNPEFLAFVREAKKHKIYTSTSTNAHFITKQKALEIVESGLDRLIISIDGITQKTYENYRINGSLEKVIEGTKNLTEAKKQIKSNLPHLIFQFLVVKQNEHEVHEIFQLAKRLGIDEVRLKSAQVYNFENGNVLIPENESFSRYVKNKNGTYRLKSKPVNHCWRMWSSCVFTWDAKIVPCCFDKDAMFLIGAIDNYINFATIWHSKTYMKFREQILLDRSQIEICKNCSEGSKVWI
jgi:radical SAM protein with 4Fe4S-binding SPASM domain